MSCGIICRFAQNCHFRTEKPESDDPENCSEYWELEDYWWDAQNDYEPEDNTEEDVEEDDFDEEDM